MRYQLVLQFASDSINDLDELIEVENLLVEKLTKESEVDGHDIGSREFNIFILTARPVESFGEALKLLKTHRLFKQFRAAYRECGKSEYVILWPHNLTVFEIT